MEQEEYSRAQMFYHSPENIGEALPLSSPSSGSDPSTRFSQMAIRTVDDNSLIVAQVAVAPFGKTLKVSFATAEIRVFDRAEPLSAYIYCQSERVLYFLTPTKVFDQSASTNTLGADYWSISQPTQLVAVAGEAVWFVIAKSQSSGRMDVTFSIFGDLYDVRISS